MRPLHGIRARPLCLPTESSATDDRHRSSWYGRHEAWRLQRNCHRWPMWFDQTDRGLPAEGLGKDDGWSRARGCADGTSLLARTARDGDDLSVDPSAVLGEQESDDSCHIFGQRTPTERAMLSH